MQNYSLIVDETIIFWQKGWGLYFSKYEHILKSNIYVWLSRQTETLADSRDEYKDTVLRPFLANQKPVILRHVNKQGILI